MSVRTDIYPVTPFSDIPELHLTRALTMWQCCVLFTVLVPFPIRSKNVLLYNSVCDLNRPEFFIDFYFFMKISDFAILAVRVSMKTSENWLLEYWADNKTSVTACCRNWLKQWWPSMNWYLSSVVPASLECVCFCDKLYGFTLFFVVTFPCCCWLQWA